MIRGFAVTAANTKPHTWLLRGFARTTSATHQIRGFDIMIKNTFLPLQKIWGFYTRCITISAIDICKKVIFDFFVTYEVLHEQRRYEWQVFRLGSSREWSDDVITPSGIQRRLRRTGYQNFTALAARLTHPASSSSVAIERSFSKRGCVGQSCDAIFCQMTVQEPNHKFLTVKWSEADDSQ